jgi:hypothetical protein
MSIVPEINWQEVDPNPILMGPEGIFEGTIMGVEIKYSKLQQRRYSRIIILADNGRCYFYYDVGNIPIFMEALIGRACTFVAKHEVYADLLCTVVKSLRVHSHLSWRNTYNDADRTDQPNTGRSRVRKKARKS